MNDNCLCGSQKQYSNCCDVFIQGKQSAPTPLALMRSRYTAYVKQDIAYLKKTVKEKAALHFNESEAAEWAKLTQWLGLEIIRADKEFVEFRASYLLHNKKHTIHELSEFRLIEGNWYYVNGKQAESADKKTGRNDACPCGSGQKYKKCCG